MLIIYLVLIIILILWKFKIRNNDEYISIDRCNSIKGIFILLIFLSHSMYYITLNGYQYVGLDKIVFDFRYALGQLVVVMFLFYSGYGVALSITKKGKHYVNEMPRHRILPTLINFDVAVMAYVILNLILAKPMTIQQIALSLLGWDSVGNSNWYIFDILICYFISFIIAKFATERYRPTALLFCIIAFVCVMSYLKKSYWYDTLFAYPAGFWFASYKDKTISFIKRNYAYVLIALLGLFIISQLYIPKARGLSNNMSSIWFAFIIVMLSMKIEIGNPFLGWCGKNLFPLYIYQRIPMIVMFELLDKGFLSNYALLFVLISVAFTSFIAYFYKYWKVTYI